MRVAHARRGVAALLIAAGVPASAGAQEATPVVAQPASARTAGPRVPAADLAPSLVPLIAPVGGPAAASELRDVVERYTADRAALLRRYDVAHGAERRARLREFQQAWQARLREVPYDALGVEGRIDYVLLASRLEYELRLLARAERHAAEMARYAPFLGRVTALQELRRRMEAPDAPRLALALDSLTRAIDTARRTVDRARKPAAGAAGARAAKPARPRNAAAARADSIRRADSVRVERIVAYRTANTLAELRTGALASWYRYYSGYDPAFTWWIRDPYKRVDAALERYVKTLRDSVVGYRKDEDEPIIGDAVGAEGLAADFGLEMIAYTPEELIAIAEREYAWCLEEMKKASRELGFGDDWKRALEQVKNSYVAPGRQPDLIRDLALEATAFVESRDLVTVPPLAKEVWRMEMLSPERQKVSPFFLGGEVIQVSYPTDSMETADKLMSLRGNNPHFSRATVHHELIPGHHLQQFMTQRYNAHRQLFSTPFWTEGWALYWEFLLWDLGFPRGPEDKVGMLFWRMHRTQRIIFSLRVHLGTMTPQQAIDLLVDKVGHERANAEAEVRRSFNGSYPPVYQAAYMLGALQIRALREELVGGGRMTEKQFHDAFLQGGRVPIEMVRARLLQQALPVGYKAQWRFYGEPVAKASAGRGERSVSASSRRRPER